MARPVGARGAGARSGSKGYLPDGGDLIWLSFDPQAGHEQAGRRPALVVSPAAYNGPSGLAFVCPITSQKKGYPFEVDLPPGLPISGVVLADHMRSADWRARRAERIARVGATVLDEVRARLAPVLGY
ncbi:MAG: endoribonuclease MazF [Alphaproteobacteria bacterium]|nr:endoribonuclease MazF [Alphaproteobacteria bacterium]